MSVIGHQSIVRCLKVSVLTLTVVVSATGLSPAQDKGAPPWGEFLRQFKLDPLLRTPYHMDPEEGVKGLAAKLRARELDVPNRKKAIRYLKELDCVQFPEAKEMLLKYLDPEFEKWEEVRYEAALGLRDMLTRHSCNPNAASGTGGTQTCQCETCRQQAGACDQCGDQSLWQRCCQTAKTAGSKVRRDKKSKDSDTQAPCYCRSCCDAKTLNTLARTAYELKEDGCCYEPSTRVREMAVAAISACGVPCTYRPYYEGEEQGPPAWDEAGGGGGNNNIEVVPPGTDETAPAADATPALLPIPGVTGKATPIARLSGYCIVSLAHGVQTRSDPTISSEYRGRIYYFANEAARQEFAANPSRFAIAFGGCDPVHFVQTKQPVEGRYLGEYEGHFYMFATEENHRLFRANPERYALSAEPSRVTTASR